MNDQRGGWVAPGLTSTCIIFENICVTGVFDCSKFSIAFDVCLVVFVRAFTLLAM